MATAAYVAFVRHVWTDGRTVATNNFALMAIALDLTLAVEWFYG
jgi:hypothetical protein